ncbi:MAG: ATP-dependent RNA helicase DbpA [Bdellovibrionaceae bacterium]|nr:ATP-dependent RNA helicase DbpA [Pseudobdellovibrionaceae bacterium]
METNSFASLPLSSEILSVVQELGFTQMTPIQTQSIPLLLEGKDIVGRSKTGSGKTAAFMLPILQNLVLKQRTVQALILCPTRELSVQVSKEARKFGRRLNDFQVVAVYGGVPAREQIISMQSGPQIVVGTPGRVLDLIDRRVLDLQDVKTFVLDEADKMLEMGFEDELLNVVRMLPQVRQTALFSATFPETLKSISRKFQKKPVEVKIEGSDDSGITIDQVLYEYEDSDDKVGMLMRVLQQHPTDSTLVFCNQKATVNDIVAKFSEQGVPCGALHGDFEQRDRDRVVSLFRNGSYRILIATDVAARGLDIENLELVVNFDFPLQAETYVHRIGRTGRAGKSGMAVLLAKPNETLKILELEHATKGKFQKPKLGFKHQYNIATSHSVAAMQTISIGAGRKDKLRPGDILGALTNPLIGLKATDVGKIEVKDHHSFVAVNSNQAQTVLRKLRESKIKGKKFPIKLIG